MNEGLHFDWPKLVIFFYRRIH